jgi:hypothetical protein
VTYNTKLIDDLIRNDYYYVERNDSDFNSVYLIGITFQLAVKGVSFYGRGLG